MLAGITIGIGVVRNGWLGGGPPVDPTVSKFIPSGHSGFITSDSMVFKVKAAQ
jgi:hypothetical protein